MLKTVAVVLIDEFAPFEFGVLCEVFAINRTEDGVPPIEFRVCAVRPGVPLGSQAWSEYRYWAYSWRYPPAPPDLPTSMR